MHRLEQIMRGGFLFTPAFHYLFHLARSSRPLGLLPTLGNALVICGALRSFPLVWLTTFV
jgi:hypothetical protein